MHHRRVALLAALIAPAALVAPGPANAATLTDLGSFTQPVYLAAPPGDDSRLMVVQKEGVIRVVSSGAQGTFLDVDAAVPNGVQSTGEQGLLSMAFAPDYATSGRFYVYYTADDGTTTDGSHNRVDEFTVSPNRSQADPTSRHLVIELPHNTGAANHNGGQIAFGPDGKLYIAPGDAATSANSQSANNVLGKVLRIAPTPGGGYTSPPDNPYAAPGNPGRDEILHVGLRNPYRFSFDRLTGDLIVGDVGESTEEEVTLLPAGTPGGRNLGWPICEGPCGGSPPPNYFGPALYYSQGSPRAVTGGVVVRDASLPELYGCYVYGDFYEGAIRATTLRPQAQAGHGPTTGLSVDGLAGFGQDNAGRVYAAALNGGHVYRIDATGAPRAACATAVPSGAGGDKTAPKLRTKTKRRQRVLHQHGVIGYGRCPGESCKISMSGRVRIGKLSYPLHKVTKAASADKRLRLRVKLTKRAKANLKKARKRHKRAVVDVAYRARDAAGNRSKLGRIRVRVTG
jgi:glucose/arabinose dehydrogenase